MTHRTRSVALTTLVLALALLVPAVHADDGESARERAAAAAFEALRTAMEARLQTAEALFEMGRSAEALEVLRSVDDLWERDLARIEALLGRSWVRGPSVRVEPAPGPLVPSRLPEEPADPGTVNRAIVKALDWLARQQQEDGRWTGPRSLYEPGLTGLATLAFLGQGITDRSDHRHAEVVGRALAYLVRVQDPEGCFGPRTSQHFVYNHAAAALAVVSAYNLTRNPRLRGPVQQALDFVALARNPYFAWRYGVKPGDNDTSVTAWMVSVLASARSVNEADEARGGPPVFTIDAAAFEGARTWIEKMTDATTGRIGYIQRGGSPARPQSEIDRFPADRSEAMTAAGLWVRLLSGDDGRSEVFGRGAGLLLRLLPRWDVDGGYTDFYYWFYGTLVMKRYGGEAWFVWRDALLRALLPNQRDDGAFDPVGPWGNDGGPVYATAIGALMLETANPESPER
jgi:hypothetical protein